MTKSSYGVALRSMLVIGSAQVVNILVSILRLKALAILLGPSGVGLLSIYQNFQNMVITGAGLGLSSSGVREIAAAREDASTLDRVRQVLLTAHLVQGGLALLGVWLLRTRIAEWLFGDASFALEVGLVGLAILLSLLATAQRALLQGLRRIADLGRVTVIGALVGTIAGLAAVWFYGQAGLIWFVLVQPFCNLITAYYFVRKLPRTANERLSLTEIPRIWLPMARLGFAFMIGGLVTAITLLLVRSYITNTMGLGAAGHFAAAWSVTMTYVGFLLGAMAADYYPRLSEAIHDKKASVALMNDQSQLGMAIGGPVLLLLIGWAPWVISLLYSSEFEPAVGLLQWQSVGNIFKLASWPLGFSLAAAARAKTFLFTQVNFNMLFLAFLAIGFPLTGLVAAGPAFTAAYMLHFMVLLAITNFVHGYRPDSLTVRIMLMHVVLAIGLLALSLMSPTLALIAAPFLAIVTSLIGLRTVLSKVGSSGRLATRLTAMFTRIGWPIPEDT